MTGRWPAPSTACSKSPASTSHWWETFKTGTTWSYSWLSIAVQMAAYSRANDLYRQGAAEDGSEDTREPMPAVDQQYGLIMWLNADKAALELFLVDLSAGWDAFELSMRAHNIRKRKDWSVELDQRPGPVVQDNGDLTPLLEASVLRKWLQEWINVIGTNHAARVDLSLHWPDHIPALRNSNAHTPDQLAAIEQLLRDVESRHGDLPFGPSKPTPQDGKVLDLFASKTTKKGKQDDKHPA